MVNKYLFILISILFYFNQLRQSGSTFSYQSWKAWIRILKSVGGKTGSGSHASSIFSPLYAEKNSPSFVGEVWLLAACLCVHKHGRNCAYFTCIKRRDPVLQDIRADNFNADDNSSNSAPSISMLTTIRQVGADNFNAADNSSNSAPTISLLTTIRQIRRRQGWRYFVRFDADHFKADDNSSDSAPTISMLTTLRQIWCRQFQCWRQFVKFGAVNADDNSSDSTPTNSI